MTKKKALVVTSLDEIRAQAEPDIVEIPGFRPGTVICVKLRLLDLTPKLLEMQGNNALLAEAVNKVKDAKKDGKQTIDELKQEIAGEIDRSSFAEGILASMDDIAKEALVEPTYEEITAIQPLTLVQKATIFNYVMGEDLLPFR